jgi:hypothetical protein
LQDKGAQRPVFSEKTDRSTTERLTEAKDASSVHTRISRYSIIRGIHHDPY